MEVQVEVQFTVQHTLEELKTEFVRRGHIPAWHRIADTELRPDLFFETRIVSVTLAGEPDRLAWFIFSMEACGELRNRIIIPNVVPSGVRVDYPSLEDFLTFCRHCLVTSPDKA
nr:hypothetical protein [uncultured Holophaga sp.]